MTQAFLKSLDKMNEDERRIHLPFNLGDEFYPTPCLSKDSIFGAAHTGEIKDIKNPVLIRCWESKQKP